MRALVFGEILWDIIEGKAHLGGAPLNFAAHVKKCGGESAIISCLGTDELGEKALDLVKATGVDTSMMQWSDRETGYVPVQIVNGQPQYEIIKDVAYDYIQVDRAQKESFSDYDTFYFGSLIQRSEISRSALYHILDNYTFKNVFYDVNLRKDCYTSEIVKRSLSYCNILKLNDEEVEVISDIVFAEKLTFEEFCMRVGNKFPQIKTIIITAGGDGAYVFDDNKLVLVPTEPIGVVDTVGAGDAFSAAFVTVFHKSQDAIGSVSIANKVGGFVASSHGAMPEYSDHIKSLFQV